MGVVRLTPWPRRATVREDWLSWLPPGKEEIFEATHQELEVTNAISSVILNEAFTLCRQGKMETARQQAVVFADFFERLASRLQGVAAALEAHSRRFRTPANVVPLRSDCFRSDGAQRVAYAASLQSVFLFRSRARFLHKVRAIGEVVGELRKQEQTIAAEANTHTPHRLPKRWAALEILHYDLNTCVRETTIVLKSFFCVLPDEELVLFRKRLFALVPAIAVRTRGSAQVVTKIVPAHCELAEGRRQAPDGGYPERGTPPQTSLLDRDNSRSRDGIPRLRMSPDGTGGPNETN
jgi:hypothetical protein